MFELLNIILKCQNFKNKDNLLNNLPTMWMKDYIPIYSKNLLERLEK